MFGKKVVKWELILEGLGMGNSPLCTSAPHIQVTQGHL